MYKNFMWCTCKDKWKVTNVLGWMASTSGKPASENFIWVQWNNYCNSVASNIRRSEHLLKNFCMLCLFLCGIMSYTKLYSGPL